MQERYFLLRAVSLHVVLLNYYYTTVLLLVQQVGGKKKWYQYSNSMLTQPKSGSRPGLPVRDPHSGVISDRSSSLAAYTFPPSFLIVFRCCTVL